MLNPVTFRFVSYIFYPSFKISVPGTDIIKINNKLLKFIDLYLILFIHVVRCRIFEK